MTGVLMQALDTTIANVALPYMEGSLAASRDQITWVLTSYIIAAAIMTAPVGWLAARFGKKPFLITCLVGFTIASMLCGAAQSLDQMVLFRLVQGCFGAALGPLSQAVMLDMYPPQKRGSVMAIWGMGVMLGPILGPTLGGILTDAYNWRWVFYINLPFGIAAVAALMIFFKDTARDHTLKFDWFGFMALSVGLASLQLLLDRGTDKGWFDSPEIVIEAIVAGTAFYLFFVHMATAKKPFIPIAIFKDRNFVGGMVLMFVMGPGAACQFGAAFALFAGFFRPHRHPDRLSNGAARIGHHVRHAVRRPSDHEDGSAPVDDGGRAVSLVHGMALDAGCERVRAHLCFLRAGRGHGAGVCAHDLVARACPAQLRTDIGLTNPARNIGSAIRRIADHRHPGQQRAGHSFPAFPISAPSRALGLNSGSPSFHESMIPGMGSLNSLINYRAQVQAYANDFLFMFYTCLPVFVAVG